MQNYAWNKVYKKSLFNGEWYSKSSGSEDVSATYQ